MQGKPRAKSRHNHKGEVIDHVHKRSHGVANDISDDAGFGELVAGVVELLYSGILKVICGDGFPRRDLFLYDAVEFAKQLLTAKIILPHQGRHDTGYHDGE